MAGLYFGSGIDKGFEKDLVRMNAKLNGLTKNVQKQSGVMNSAFSNVTKTVGGMLSVMAVGAAGKELISFSNDLETALTEVSTISQAVTEDFEGYKDAIVALSTESATSAIKLTEAYYDIVSAGYDGAQGLELLAAAERASTAGFVEVGIAADGLTTVLNAWGKSATEAANVSDIFFKTVEKGKTTFPELGSNIAQVAPIAASMNVSFEEISGAIATLTKQGTPTAQAFTQIRSSLLAMNEELGDGWADVMTYQEGLLEVQKRANGSTNELKNMLGRVEAVNAVLGLTGKNAQIAAQDLAAMNEALGATNIAAEKVLLTTEQQVKILKNNILAALEPLSAGASELIGDIAEKLNKAFESGDIQKYTKLILQLVKAFATYKVSVIAMNQVNKLRRSILLNDIKLTRQQKLVYLSTGKAVSKSTLLMASANKTATKSFKALTTAFKANPIGWIATGLTLVIPLIERFRNKTKEATTDQDEFNDSLQKTRDLLAGFQDIEKRQAIIGLLSEDELKDQQSRIKTALNEAREFNTSLKEDLRERLNTDRELQELSAKLSNKNIVDIVKAGYASQYERRKQAIGADLELQNKANQDRVKELERYLKEVDKVLKTRPEQQKKQEIKNREDLLKRAEIDYQKTKNELITQYNDREDLEQEFHNKMLENDLEYLDKKRKLSIDELEKLLIEQEILNKRFSAGYNLQKIERKIPETGLKDIPYTKTESKIEETATGSIQAIDQAFSEMGDSIVVQLSSIGTNVVEAFETINSESSTTSDKISGIVSLIIAAGNLIKDVVTNYWDEGVDAQDRINQGVAAQISAERTINEIIRERNILELESSAFLDASYKDRYNLALQTLRDSETIFSESLQALNQGITLTATGYGEGLFGLSETSKEFSFTLDEIIQGASRIDDLATHETLANIFDPIGLFGGAAEADAAMDAYTTLVNAVNSGLKSMGKTAADMANFSQEEWSDFYTILDEGGFVADEGTKQLVESMKEAQEAYQSALDEMRDIITGVAGSLGDELGDSIVNAVANGTDALNEFEDSLNKVFLEMAKAQMNQLFFQGLFDQLQEEMEESMTDGDQDWQDDLLRFYDKLPDAISGAEDFMRQFDDQLKELGFEGVTGEGVTQSTAGQIRQSITEETGTILAGHIGEVRLSNERIANYSEESLDLAIQNLVVMNKIKENTDYLPEIAENTKKTYQKLGGI